MSNSLIFTCRLSQKVNNPVKVSHLPAGNSALPTGKKSSKELREKGTWTMFSLNFKHLVWIDRGRAGSFKCHPTNNLRSFKNKFWSYFVIWKDDLPVAGSIEFSQKLPDYTFTTEMMKIGLSVDNIWAYSDISIRRPRIGYKIKFYIYQIMSLRKHHRGLTRIFQKGIKNWLTDGLESQ